MISYDEHEKWLVQQLDGLAAEYWGYMQAKLGTRPKWSADQYIQDRFDKGYADGQAKLLQDSLTQKAEEE
jgi:hypothetical protein